MVARPPRWHSEGDGEQTRSSAMADAFIYD